MDNNICKAIHLPADLNSSRKSGIYQNSDGSLTKYNTTTGKMQHLYFVSSEKISEDDWCFGYGEIIKWNSKERKIISPARYKKIIATTDRNLGLLIIKKIFVSLYIQTKGNTGNMSINIAINFTYVLKEHKRGEKLYKKSEVEELLYHYGQFVLGLTLKNGKPDRELVKSEVFYKWINKYL